MVKIQNVGVGNFIRDPRGRHGDDSRSQNVEALIVVANEGNSFRCHPITDAKSVPVTYDLTRFQFIPIDTMVEQVTV